MESEVSAYVVITIRDTQCKVVRETAPHRPSYDLNGQLGQYAETNSLTELGMTSIAIADLVPIGGTITITSPSVCWVKII